MPYAENQGVRIYYEIEGEGPPLVLHHGLTDSPKLWRIAGYIEPLAKQYQTIILHVRGHGRSDKPHNPEAYSSESYVSDVVAVMDHQDHDKAHFWGYSLGGRVGLATGKYAPDRFVSVIVGGNWPVERDSKLNIDDLKGAVNIFKKGAEAIIAYYEEMKGERLSDLERDLLLEADFEAALAYCAYRENIGMVEYLPTLATPHLFYAGDQDTFTHSNVERYVESMQNAKFISLPGLNHETAFYRSDLVLPHVLRFLSDNS